MKRIFYRAAIITFFILLFLSNSSYSFVKTDYRSNVIMVKSWPAATSGANILSDMKKLGYDGDSLTKEMKILNNSIEIIEKSGSRYKIGLKGSGSRIGEVDFYSYKNLIEQFGLDSSVPESSLNVGYSWPANMIVSAPGENLDNIYTIYLEKLYTGSDLNQINSETTNNQGSSTGFGDAANTAGNVADTAVKVASWVAEFLKNPAGKITTLLMDGILFISDAFQAWGSTFQTGADHTSSDSTVTYKYDDLKRDGQNENISKNQSKESELAIGNRDKYTKVGEYIQGDKKSWQKVIDVDKATEGETYTKDTEIPVMVGDIYNIIANRIDFFDTNFLTGNKDKKADGKTQKHKNGSSWMVLRNFGTGVMHVILYASSAILLLALIYYGIKLVGHSLDNPSARAEYKKGLEKFAKALFMLIGSVVIMALCIFGTNTLCEQISGTDDESELPIRVNVENAEYSFSTTYTGYIRYMASIDDVDQALRKSIYTLGYMVLVAFNFIAMIFMALRVLILLGLSMIGPLTAAMYVFGKKAIVSYKSWVEIYIALSIVPIIAMTIVYKLLLATI